MNELFLAAKIVHILALTSWVGGMIFVAAVMAPKLRNLPPQQRGSLFSELGRRFSKLGWIAIALLALSGFLQALVRAGDLFRAFSGTFGTILTVKLVLVFLLVVESALHDFVLGPRQTMWEQRMSSGEVPPAFYWRLRRTTQWLARTQLLGAIAVIVLGVLLTRTGF